MPAGITAQGDSTWFQTNSAYPPNSLSSITNFAPGTFQQIGIYAYWSQIQKPDGTYDFSAVDTALCSLQAYNTANNDHVKAKLRIVPDSRQISSQTNVTETASPAAELAQGGIPGGTIIYSSYGTVNQKTMSVGAYYLNGVPGDYTSMSSAMNDALAARYDANTLISAVSVETCASVDLEPWLQASDTTSLANLALFTPAFTEAQKLKCLVNAPNSYSSWKLTPLMDVMGAYNCLGDGTVANCPQGKTSADYVDTKKTMTTYSAAFGARFAYESNGMRPFNVNDGDSRFTNTTPGAAGGPPDHWALYGTNASPVSYQPLNPNIPIADLINLTQNALLYCMTQLELNSQAQLGGSGNTPKVTQSDLNNLQSIINAGPPGGVNWNGQACKNK